jgi:hypothetical protein
MKLSHEFIKLPLAVDIERLAAEVMALPEEAWGEHAARFHGNSAVPLISVNGENNDANSGPMQPTEYLRACPYIQQILEHLNVVFGRSRLMRIAGKGQVPEHSDMNYHWFSRVRIHIPVVTHPEVSFHCDRKRVHMAAGEVWIFDNWLQHRVDNPVSSDRIHLVVDTQGSADFWSMVERAVRSRESGEEFQLERIPYRREHRAVIRTERFNIPGVMSPGEMEGLIEDLLDDVRAAPFNSRDSVRRFADAVRGFCRDWRMTWSLYGQTDGGWDAYQALRAGLLGELAQMPEALGLASNRANAEKVLLARVLMVALPVALPEPEVDSARIAQDRLRRTATVDRPVIILAAPRSGSTMLFETLARAEALWTIGGEGHEIIEGVEKLNPSSGAVESNRLTAEHADPETAGLVRQRLLSILRDRNGVAYDPSVNGMVRVLEKTPKNALRLPFLDRLYPDARYIFLFREPRQNISSIMEAWRAVHWVTYRNLPGWEGDWSMLLPPGYHEMRGRPLEDVAAFQWDSANRFILDDLGQTDPERWTAISYQDLVENPDAEIRRLCAFAEIPFDAVLSQHVAKPLPHSRLTLTPPSAEKWKKNADAIEKILPSVLPTYDRILETIRRVLPDHGQHDRLRQAHVTPTAHANVSRMQACPCGSGKRYKHCHGILNTEKS